MRYASGVFYALAIVGGRHATFDMAVVGALIFCGTVALCFAVEGIVKAAVAPTRSDWGPSAIKATERMLPMQVDPHATWGSEPKEPPHA